MSSRDTNGADRGSDKYLRWRSTKKKLLIQYQAGNEEYAWELLKEMMLMVNRNFDEVMEGKRANEIRNNYREDNPKDSSNAMPKYSKR